MTAGAVSRLLHLYPRRWRDRYGDEYGCLLEELALTPALAWDVCRGALDAHLHFGRTERQIRAAQRARQRRATLTALLWICAAPVALPYLAATYRPPRAVLP